MINVDISYDIEEIEEYMDDEKVQEIVEYIVNTDNQINKIPKSIGDLTNLKILQLDSNKINFIPKNIGKLSNLESFYLFGNEIKNLPLSIIYLNKLKSLGISNHNVVRNCKCLIVLE